MDNILSLIQTMSKPFIRHFVGLVAGWLLAHGWLADSERAMFIEAGLGLVLALAAYGLSKLNERRQKAVQEAATRIALKAPTPDVVTVTEVKEVVERAEKLVDAGVKPAAV